MRKIIVNEWMSFDGVVQSAGADDDTSNGFAHGGWHVPYMDDTAQKWIAAYLAEAGGSCSVDGPTSSCKLLAEPSSRLCCGIKT